MTRLVAIATVAEVGCIITPCLTLYLTLKLVVPSVPVSSGTHVHHSSEIPGALCWPGVWRPQALEELVLVLPC